MKELKEPEAIEELHQIRADMAHEAHKVGVTKYYLAMNKRAKWSLGAERKPQTRDRKELLVVREHPSKKYEAK
jgi:hypothetical protein